MEVEEHIIYMEVYVQDSDRLAVEKLSQELSKAAYRFDPRITDTLVLEVREK